MGIIKPKIGEPCNNCGICCMTQPCMNGAYALGLVKTLGEHAYGRCPALTETSPGKFVCGIILNPKKYIKNSKYPADVLSRNFKILIGSGNGCDELLDDDSESEEDNLSEMLDRIQSHPDFERKVKIAIKVIHGI